MTRVAVLLALVCSLGLSRGIVLAQLAPQAFEVVSIKARVGPAPLGGGGNAPDRFERPDTDLMLPPIVITSRVHYDAACEAGASTARP